MFKTKVMAVLNVTPDSYFQKSRFYQLDEAVEAAIRFEKEGADFIDIGGESTSRAVYMDHNSQIVDDQTEIERVVPVIEAIKNKISIPISIDTMKPVVAEAALKAGASLLNDISGFRDPKMIEVAAKYDCDICVMHMQGTPKTMQINPCYPEGVIPHLLHWFDQRIKELLSFGIKEKRIILDPGICFGKTVADNFTIIENLPKLKKIGFPLLLGISRKSFIAKTINKPCEELLPATIAINTFAILSKVDIIRVHDVKEHRDAIDALSKLNALTLA